MSSRTLLFRFAFLIILLLVSTPGVSGWTFQNWAQSPSGTELAPGTPVTVSYTLHFDSWATGSTFNKDNSLTMYTDLASPQWVVKKVETLEEQPPIVEQVPVRQAAQTKLDGWTLSYSGKRFDLNVQLTGTTPALNESRSISVIRLQEMSPGAKPVAGSLVKKEITVTVPTPEPTFTAAPAVAMTPEETIVVTMVPQVQGTPTKKVTYSPGPEPVLVVGVLAGLVCVLAMTRRKH
ncbi:MAG: hypothetical protein Q8R70_05970 [Methanoregula sp.]|nr:hypothetical protein [Methanoregula sp.]